MSAATFREGDVVRYAPERDWCRDTTATVERRRDGLVLLDTYWTTDRPVLSTIEAATAKVLFNLNDYERVNHRSDFERYAPDDRRELSTQHGHCPRFYVRKGAQPHVPTILDNYRRDVEDAERMVASAQASLEGCRRVLAMYEAEHPESVTA
jgi:hypothetical protein